MSKEIFISSTPHETRLAIVENEVLTEIYYERENEYTLAGSIYNGRVTRVLPGMQSSFVDIGLERDAFLYITDFMEEAPDSAEFDTSSNGDHAPRGARTPSAERSEEPATGGRPEGGRSGEPGRGEGRGRGRRGGRDRNSDRERTPQVASEAGVAPVEASPDAVGQSEETAQVGEGAPGADGNRRWRGRRGRRRGRGPGGAGLEGTPVNGAPANNENDEDESGLEIDGVASIETAPAVQPIAAPEQPQSNRQGGRDDSRREGGSRDGRRDRAQGDDRSRQESRRDQRPPRAPRGFEPSQGSYGAAGGDRSGTGPVADAYPDESGVAVEPIVLPGESLSKYRKGGDEPQPVAAKETETLTLAPPANLYTVAEGWDGGAVLPGETLRRRSEPARQDSRREARPARRDYAETRSEQSVGRRERVEVPVTPIATEATVEVDQVHDAIIPEASADAVFAEAVVLHSEPVQIAAERVSAPPAVIEPSQHGIAQEPVEYEPDEAASASYRVDPLSRREFRQGSPVMEEDEIGAAHSIPLVEGLLDPVPAVSMHTVRDPEPAEHSIAHLVTPQPDEVISELHADVGLPIEDEAQPSALPLHEITSISPAGEMFSERVDSPETAAVPPGPVKISDPTSPVHHEGAVLAEAAEASHSFAPVPVIGAFSPGEGAVDEEVLDEEDFYGSTIHASSIEEMDDLEEDNLEGAADLGTMLREMSIDQITRTAPEAADEDELDEDDLEEDDLAEDDFDEGDAEDASEEAPEHYELEGSEDSEDGEASARTGTAEDAKYFEAQFGQSPEGDRRQNGERSASGSPDRGQERTRREGGRRDGRRSRNDRSRSGNGGGDRGSRSQNSGGRSRQSMQATNLPAISDLLKPGQEILVQIAKEPIAKKGARITSHIALPGRFLVFMPTVNHTGVSRKIESDGERRRLKEILLSEKGEAAGGFIVRTAAEGASEEELRSDLRFLLNLWNDIKARSESSKSPALIYHDLNLIERILRDQVTDNFSAIWTDSETEYERVLRFLQRFQPSLIRRVKLYTKETPLFEQFGITEEINKALRSKVWLKSGGSIVINQTEALVAIDINTGKFVGKTARLEDTIVKTNLDAIPEIVRQIRLRDLGGIIIIDFIDMDERKNRNRVMAALEEELKADRAPSKVLQFNDFGLVAITRKRVKQSLERTLSTTCNVCVGTGMVKSPITVCNDIYVEMRKMHRHLDRGDVMLRVHPEVVKQLKVSGAKWLQEMEEMCGKTILVKSDPSLHPEQFDIH
jgi:ribonuclease E